MKLKDKWKEIKIPNLDADINLLKKRKKNTKYFGIYHFVFYIIFFFIGIYAFFLILNVCLVDNPSLQLIHMTIGLSMGVNVMFLFCIKNYLTALDWARDSKFYDLLIYLKENKGEKL